MVQHNLATPEMTALEFGEDVFGVQGKIPDDFGGYMTFRLAALHNLIFLLIQHAAQWLGILPFPHTLLKICFKEERDWPLRNENGQRAYMNLVNIKKRKKKKRLMQYLKNHENVWI